jgi:hypothetical protein
MERKFNFLLLLIFFITTAGFGQQQWITVYTDNFSGNYYEFEPGRYNNTYLGLSGIPQVRSVRIPPGMQVTLYSQDDFRGQSLTLTADASTDYLKSKGFDDPMLTISMAVDRIREVPAGEPVVTVFQHDYSGASKTLGVGRYDLRDLEPVPNDQLSSLKIPTGLKVTLYEHDGFRGRSLILIKDTPARVLVEKKFNDFTSSLVVEAVEEPKQEQITTPHVNEVEEVVTLYQGDFNGLSITLGPGRYGVNQLGIGNDELSSIKIPHGLRVVLYEESAFQGRSWVLTQDARAEVFEKNNFNNKTSSMLVEPLKNSTLVTLYEDNFSGLSRSLPPGKYDVQQLGIGDKALSSISIPWGYKVQLFDKPAFEGLLMTLRADTDQEFLTQNNSNNRVRSIIIEPLPTESLTVTIYRDVFEGVSQNLVPGRYTAHDLTIGEDQLSSLIVPKGLKVILYQDDNFTSDFTQTIIGRNESDLTRTWGNVSFDNAVSSIVVEIHNPRDVNEYASAEFFDEPSSPVETKPEVPTVPACTMTAKQYTAAVKAIQTKSFSDEKKSVARQATKGKCLTNDQIRGLAKAFNFEDQMLDFLKYAYPLSEEKATYASLGDLFKFPSNKNEFAAFVRSKK